MASFQFQFILFIELQFLIVFEASRKLAFLPVHFERWHWSHDSLQYAQIQPPVASERKVVFKGNGSIGKQSS